MISNILYVIVLILWTFYWGFKLSNKTPYENPGNKSAVYFKAFERFGKFWWYKRWYIWFNIVTVPILYAISYLLWQTFHLSLLWYIPVLAHTIGSYLNERYLKETHYEVFKQQ